MKLDKGMDKGMSKMAKSKTFKHDFGDGMGPVKARYHMNQTGFGRTRVTRGGIVSSTAHVSETAFVARTALVYGFASVDDHVEIYNDVRVYGSAIVEGYACLSGRVRVGGAAHIGGGVVCGGDCVLLRGKYHGNLRLNKSVMLTFTPLTIMRTDGHTFTYAPNHASYININTHKYTYDTGHIDEDDIAYKGKGEWYVHAGCRTFTMPEARAHWGAYKKCKYPYDKRVKYEQTMIILDTLEKWAKSQIKYGI